MNTISIIKVFLLFPLSLSVSFMQAQDMRAPYATAEAGWKKKIVFNTPPQTMKVDDRNFSTQQVGEAQTMVSWMQETFSPKGMIGEAKWYLNLSAKSEPVTSKYFDLNEAAKRNRTALPHSWGAYSRFYVFLKKDATGKWVQETDHNIRWNIEVNGLEAISKQIAALSTPEAYYFLMRRYALGMKGLMESESNRAAAAFRNFSNHPALKKYDHYFLPTNVVTPTSLPSYVIIITKDEKPLPFEHVTVGEFVTQCEKQVPMLLQMPRDPRDAAKFKERVLRGFQIFKERFAKKSDEKVYLDERVQFDLLVFANADEKSTFRWLQTEATEPATGYTYFPLLKSGKTQRDASAKGEALWFVTRWEPPMSKTHDGDLHYMDAILTRFNYDYVYSYFFGTRPVDNYRPTSN